MRAADITLHWAKADGKNRWACFDKERNAKEIARFTLSATMPAALARGEFYVDYQPLLRLSDNVCYGVEALVRWAHPEFGRLPPDRQGAARTVRSRFAIRAAVHLKSEVVCST